MMIITMLSQALSPWELPDGQALKFSLDDVLSPYMWVFFAAFAVSFAMTPLMRRLALYNGIVDWPDLKRKAHVDPVAYLGGVAVFLGWLAGMLACFLVVPHYVEPLKEMAADGSLPERFSGMWNVVVGTTMAENAATPHIAIPTSILYGASIITVVGFWDDVYGISPSVKVGGQILAAALLAAEDVGTQLAAGVLRSVGSLTPYNETFAQWASIGDPTWAYPVYWIGAAFVVIIVVGGCNATNLLDGLDGLASGVTAIVATGFAVISVCLAMGLYTGYAYSPILDPVRIAMCLALLGATLGFLPYNFNPATIFMGDAGSMLLGFLCASMVLLFAEKADPALVMAALIVFALPIIDTSVAIVRRKLQGMPIFSPDNRHLHHQLIRTGMSVRQAVIVLYLMAFSFMVLGSAMIFMRLRYVAAVFIVLFAFIVVMAWKVGHQQLRAIHASMHRPQRPDTTNPHRL